MNRARILAISIAWAVACVTLAPSGLAQPSSFTFGAAGDFDSGGNFRKTVDAVRTVNPDFLLLLGDLSYGDDEAEWCSYWKTTGKYDKLLLLSGNHDSGESSGGDINKYVAACPMAKVETKGTYGKQ